MSKAITEETSLISRFMERFGYVSVKELDKKISNLKIVENELEFMENLLDKSNDNSITLLKENSILNDKIETLKKQVSTLSKKIQEPYPKNRDGLKSLVGQKVTLSAVYVKSDDRGALVRYVNHEKKQLCDHLWLNKVNGDGFKKGDIVKITGLINKYGSMSYTKELKENYGIFNPRMKHLFGGEK